MRPADLLNCQADLHRRLSSVPEFRTVMAHSLRSPYVANNQPVPPFFEENNAVNRMATWAESGMAIEVTPHMTDLVTWVAAEMHGTDQVVLDLAPSPYGLVHFEQALRVSDIRGDVLHVSWLLWGPAPGLADQRLIGCLHLTDLHDPDSAADRYLRDMQRDFPDTLAAMDRWIYTGFGALLDGDRVGPPTNEPHPATANSDPEWQGELTGSTNLTRLVFALWTVMNQPIADIREERVDRATTRRMRRMEIPPQVTVITLRRPASHRHEGDSGVEWQHHWIVRGHPRWQPYGPSRQERKLIWINPHVKGNLDAPLKQTDKVYKVSR